ncbi:MAG: glycosyltransferase family 2 protein [Planctomycetota bacterium]|jgi:glycosyltransferase involved in cell wall biosynthesis
MKLIIQIPCYNEETTLPEVIADLPTELPGVDTIEYLVIDDGSADRTVEVARGLGVHHILQLGSNQGLANAFLRGIHYALEQGADIVVNTDGDNQYDGHSIGDLIQPVVEGQMDVVVGARPIEEIEHFSFLKKRLQRMGSYVVQQFSGTQVPDTTSGFRAYSTEAAMKLHVFNRYTYTLETIIQAGHMNPKTRESRLISSIPKYVRRSMTIILRSYMTYKPMRTFFYCAIVPSAVGLLLCLRFLYFYFSGSGGGHLQSLVLAAIMLIIAFHLVSLGILADLISANRKLVNESNFLLKKLLYKKKQSDSKSES